MRLLFTLLTMSCLACGSDQADSWTAHDLMSYKLAGEVLAPDSVEVKQSDISGISRDVSLRNDEEGYYLQIFSSLAPTNDMARLKAEQLELVRANPYFQRVISEEPQGFVFESRIDTITTFGFRYLRLQGDREQVFQNGLGELFTLEQVERMYEAVQHQDN